MCQYSGYLPGKFTYFAQSVTPGSLCHGNNIAQMPTIRTPVTLFVEPKNIDRTCSTGCPKINDPL